MQGDSLPLSQGLNHLGLLPCFADGEMHLSFDAVQVVVDAACLGNEKGRAYSLQIKGRFDFVLKRILYKFNCLLGFAQRKG